MRKFKTFTFVIALLLIFITKSTVSQFTWTRTFGGQFSNDEAYSTIQTIDGNYLTVGDSNINGIGTAVSMIIKLSQSGNLLWTKKFSTNDGIGYGVAEDPSGNLYFSTGGGILKTDYNGNILWKRLFNDSTIAFAYLKFTEDSGSLICYGYNSLGKVDSNGSLIWFKNLHDSLFDNNYIYDFAEINKTFYFTGVKQFPGFSRGFIKKYDSTGNLLWSKFMDQNCWLYSIAKSSENSLIVAGRKNDLFCGKTDLDGNLIWERSYTIDSIENCYSIVKAGNNKFALATGGYPENSKFVMIDSSGNVLINKIHYYGFQDNVLYQSIINTTDSGFIITGIIEPHNNGLIDWLVVKTDKYGNTTPIGINQISSSIPEKFTLYQNYPNPFNPSTKIKFSIPLSRGVSAGRGVFVTFKVYDITGREVYSLSETKSPGTYEITFDGAKYSSGMYFYTLQSGNYRETKKMLMIK